MEDAEDTRELIAWGKEILRDAKRHRCFGEAEQSSWNTVAALAAAVQEAGTVEDHVTILIGLATEVLMIEIESKGLQKKPRRKYYNAVYLCFHNLGSFWSENPLVHIVGELSWIVERARQRSMDAAELLDSEIGTAAFWGVPYIGHYRKSC